MFSQSQDARLNPTVCTLFNIPEGSQIFANLALEQTEAYPKSSVSDFVDYSIMTQQSQTLGLNGYYFPATIYAHENTLNIFKQLLKDANTRLQSTFGHGFTILGKCFLNPYVNNTYIRIPENIDEASAIDLAQLLQILGRGENQNTTGYIHQSVFFMFQVNGENHYLFTEDEVAILHGLVSATAVSYVSQMVKKGGFPNSNPINHENPFPFISLDHASLQFQNDPRDNGCVVFYPEHQETQERLTIKNQLHFAFLGVGRPHWIEGGRNWTLATWSSVTGYIDLTMYSEIVATKFLQVLQSANQGGYQLGRWVTFRFLKGGLGFFSAGLDPRAKLELMFYRLHGIYKALSYLDEAKNAGEDINSYISNILYIQLPYSNSFDRLPHNEDTDTQEMNLLLDNIQTVIKSLIPNSADYYQDVNQFAGSIDACDIPIEGTILALDDGGDHYAGKGNEGGYHSVDAMIYSNENPLFSQQAYAQVNLSMQYAPMCDSYPQLRARLDKKMQSQQSYNHLSINELSAIFNYAQIEEKRRLLPEIISHLRSQQSTSEGDALTSLLQNLEAGNQQQSASSEFIKNIHELNQYLTFIRNSRGGGIYNSVGVLVRESFQSLKGNGRLYVGEAQDFGTIKANYSYNQSLDSKLAALRNDLKEGCMIAMRGDGNCYYQSVINGIMIDAILENKKELVISRIIGAINDVLDQSYSWLDENTDHNGITDQRKKSNGSAFVETRRELLGKAIEFLQNTQNPSVSIENWFLQMNQIENNHAVITAMRCILAHQVIEKRSDQFNGLSLSESILYVYGDPTLDIDIDIFIADFISDYILKDEKCAEGAPVQVGLLPVALGYVSHTYLLPDKQNAVVSKTTSPNTPEFGEVHLLLKPGHYDLLLTQEKLNQLQLHVRDAGVPDQEEVQLHESASSASASSASASASAFFASTSSASASASAFSASASVSALSASASVSASASENPLHLLSQRANEQFMLKRSSMEIRLSEEKNLFKSFNELTFNNTEVSNGSPILQNWPAFSMIFGSKYRCPENKLGEQSQDDVREITKNLYALTNQGNTLFHECLTLFGNRGGLAYETGDRPLIHRLFMELIQKCQQYDPDLAQHMFYITNITRNTPAHIAAKSGAFDALRVMFEKVGADDNADKLHALLFGMKNEKGETVAQLINNNLQRDSVYLKSKASDIIRTLARQSQAICHSENGQLIARSQPARNIKMAGGASNVVPVYNNAIERERQEIDNAILNAVIDESVATNTRLINPRLTDAFDANDLKAAVTKSENEIPSREYAEPSAPPLPASLFAGANAAVAEEKISAPNVLAQFDSALFIEQLDLALEQIQCNDPSIFAFQCSSLLQNCPEKEQFDSLQIERRSLIAEKFSKIFTYIRKRSSNLEIIRMLESLEAVLIPYQQNQPSQLLTEGTQKLHYQGSKEIKDEEHTDGPLKSSASDSKISRWNIFSNRRNTPRQDLSQWNEEALKQMVNPCAQCIASRAVELLRSQNAFSIGKVFSLGNALKRDLLNQLLNYLDPKVSHKDLTQTKYSPMWFMKMIELIKEEVAHRNHMTVTHLMQIVNRERTGVLLTYLEQACTTEGQNELMRSSLDLKETLTLRK